MVCALDNDTEGTMSALATRDVAAAAVAESARKGYLDGQALEGVFTWLRPNDLVWNYFVNNYLLGKAPPAFDILYWNQDTVRLAAGLHRDFIHVGLDNSFASPGTLEVLGAPVDLGSVDRRHVLRRRASAITSSRGRARTRSALLFGGDKRFVLSRSGHIQALVNPPAGGGRVPSSFRVADELPATPEEVRRAGAAAAGKLVARLGRLAGRALRERGSRRPALGNRTYKAQEGAGRPMYSRRTDELPERPGRPLVGRSPARDALAARALPPARGSGVPWPWRGARRRPPGDPACRASAAATRPCSCSPHGYGGSDTGPHTCGFLTNAGCSDRAIDRVERRLRASTSATAVGVALIGHSRGGHYARALGHRRPELVSHAISVGAGLRQMLATSYPTQRAAGAARRVVLAERPRPIAALPHRRVRLPVRVATSSPRSRPTACA